MDKSFLTSALDMSAVWLYKRVMIYKSTILWCSEQDEFPLESGSSGRFVSDVHLDFCKAAL